MHLRILRMAIFAGLLIILVSCKAYLFKRNMVDPQVETRQTLQDFLSRHSFNTSNQFVMDADSTKKNWTLFDAMSSNGSLIFDKDGKPLCYQGESHCDGVILGQLFEGKLDSFSLCKDEPDLDILLNSLNVLQTGKKVTLEDFKGTDFFIVEYWQKFRGRKLGYKTGSDWTDRQIARHQRFRFTHININSDFLDEWGFVAGDRVKINIRKKNGGFSSDQDMLVQPRLRSDSSSTQ